MTLLLTVVLLVLLVLCTAAAHLALGMMGMGMMWNPTAREYQPAADVIAAHGLQALVLAPKVGACVSLPARLPIGHGRN